MRRASPLQFVVGSLLITSFVYTEPQNLLLYLCAAAAAAFSRYRIILRRCLINRLEKAAPFRFR